MDFKALECIVAISEGKSITQAAKNLFISQPALSQYMARVEQELGMPVFIKTGNSIALTSAGEFLAREGKSLLKARDDMLTQLSSLSSERAETLRIGISPFYSKYYPLPGDIWRRFIFILLSGGSFFTEQFLDQRANPWPDDEDD